MFAFASIPPASAMKLTKESISTIPGTCSKSPVNQNQLQISFTAKGINAYGYTLVTAKVSVPQILVPSTHKISWAAAWVSLLLVHCFLVILAAPNVSSRSQRIAFSGYMRILRQLHVLCEHHTL
jgi:hypothetical protein